MKVFISWSGEPSHTVALALREWLPHVIQSIDPYVSSEDIEQGAPWFPDIAQQLDQASFGIICVTRVNADSRWMNFEAGALFKSVNSVQRHVSPFLIDLRPTDLVGPLAQFQVTEPSLDGVAKLVRSLNALGDPPLRDALLNAEIERWWPDLEEKLRNAQEIAASQPEAVPRRGTDDMVEELLERTRSIERRITQPTAGAVNVTTSEQEGYRRKKIYDDVWEILYGASIQHRILSVHDNAVKVEVYFLAELPADVKAALDGLAERRGMTMNVTTIEHPDPEYVARR
jgi:hypothetical protein